MKISAVRLEVSDESLPFAEARDKVEALAKDHGGGALVICESLADDLWFDRYTGALPESFERSIAGRVFCEAFEVRWMREGATCRLWRLAESDAGTRYRRTDRKFYLWGMYDDKNHKFYEARNGAAFEYPLPLGSAPAPGDRAYIEVAEYMAAEPEKWPKDESGLKELEKILNQPKTLAHRFLRCKI